MRNIYYFAYMLSNDSSSYEGYITISYIDKTNKPKQKLTELKKNISKSVYILSTHRFGENRELTNDKHHNGSPFQCPSRKYRVFLLDTPFCHFVPR